LLAGVGEDVVRLALVEVHDGLDHRECEHGGGEESGSRDHIVRTEGGDRVERGKDEGDKGAFCLFTIPVVEPSQKCSEGGGEEFEEPLKEERKGGKKPRNQLKRKRARGCHKGETRTAAGGTEIGGQMTGREMMGFTLRSLVSEERMTVWSVSKAEWRLSVDWTLRQSSHLCLARGPTPPMSAL
jgi:hypothetical protein